VIFRSEIGAGMIKIEGNYLCFLPSSGVLKNYYMRAIPRWTEKCLAIGDRWLGAVHLLNKDYCHDRPYRLSFACQPLCWRDGNGAVHLLM